MRQVCFSLLLFLSSLAAFGQTWPRATNSQVIFLRQYKLNASDTTGKWLPKLPGTRAITTAEVDKLAGLPSSAVSTNTYNANRSADLMAATNPANLVQSALYRFTTDDEKITWNAKADLAAVRLAIRDSVRVFAPGSNIAFRFQGGVYYIDGSAGSGVTVDNTLNASSVNAISNAAVTAAINSANANIATNTSGLATANTTIASQGTRLTSVEGNVAANTTNIATNTSGLATANANIATNTSSISSLSALVATLQSQVSGLTGTFTIQAPTLSVSNITNTGATVTWGTSTSATSYTLESATNSGFTTGLTTLTVTSGTTYTMTGLAAGTAYYLRIRASGGAGTTASSYATTSFTTTSTLPVLSAPTGLVATATSSSAITVSWTASSNATSYTVRYSTSASMASPVSTTTASTSVSISGLTASTQYYFDVSASAGGYTTSATSTTATATTNGSLTYLRTLRIAFQSTNQNAAIPTSSTSAIGGAGTWNRMLPNLSATPNQLTTANSYTLANLVTDTNTPTSLSASIGNPFTQNTGSAITAVSNMLYDQIVMTKAWQIASTNSVGGDIIISGLTPNSIWQIGMLGAFSLTASTTFQVAGTTTQSVTKAILNNTGVGGGNEFDPNTALATFKNVRADSNGRITLSIKYFSGSYSCLNAVYMRETNTDVP